MSSRNVIPNGSRLDEYQVVGVLGVGGFGVTYKALNTRQRTLVAIKEYYPADLAERGASNDLMALSEAVESEYRWGLDRFLSEARTLLQFRHPNIVQLQKLLRLNNTAYMVLSFESGLPLRGWSRRLGRLPNQGELDFFLEPLLDALEVVHANGMLHRDISPDNILIRSNGDPVLLDFGSARHAVGMRGALSAIVKHGFSPPEQYATDSAKQGAWSDIYALAATLYFLLVGKPPPHSMTRVEIDTFTGITQFETLGYRQSFLAAIDAGLVVNPRSRPQSVQAWRRQLLSDHRPPQVSAPPIPTPGVAPGMTQAAPPFPTTCKPEGRASQVAAAVKSAVMAAKWRTAQTAVQSGDAPPIGSLPPATAPPIRTARRRSRKMRIVVGWTLLSLAFGAIVAVAIVVLQMPV